MSESSPSSGPALHVPGGLAPSRAAARASPEGWLTRVVNHTSHPPLVVVLLLVPAAVGKYTVFGNVIDGMEVLDKLEKVPTGAGDRPLQVRRLLFVSLRRLVLDKALCVLAGDKCTCIFTLRAHFTPLPPMQDIKVNRITIHANPMAG